MAKNNQQQSQQQPAQQASQPKPEPEADDPLMRVSEVAELYDVHPNTVRNWINSKALPAFRTPGSREFRVRRSHVAAIVGMAAAGA